MNYLNGMMKMSNEWLFTYEIVGAPIGKGRPRGTSAGGHIRLYTPKKTADWERSAAGLMSASWRREPLDEPVEVEIAAFAHRPKRLMRKKDPDGVVWKVSKPEADNICKCVLDSLVMGGILRDDSCVVSVRILDFFTEKDRGPRVCVRLRPVGSEPVEGWWQRPIAPPEEPKHEFIDDLPW